MRILIITPSSTGHHLEYKRLLEKAFSELGHTVFHFTPEFKKIKQKEQATLFDQKNNSYFQIIYSKYLILFTELWQIRNKSLAVWNQLFSHIKKLEKDSKLPDLIFFEYLDSSIRQYVSKWEIDGKLSIPFSGLLFQPQDTTLLGKSYLRKGFFDPYHILKSKWCISVGVLMEDAVPFLLNIIEKPVIEVPDVVAINTQVQDNSMGKHIRTLAGDRFVVGIWGSLEFRKGTSDFLKLFLNLPAGRFFFVMGGKIHLDSWPEEDRYILQQISLDNNENILINDQWLTDENLLSGIGSCDLIFAAYYDWRFTSGIIGKAAALRVPILVNDGYVMAKRVANFKIGFIKKEGEDVVQWFTDNIQDIKKTSNSSSFADGCLEYCKRYGYEQWLKSLEKLIEH